MACYSPLRGYWDGEGGKVAFSPSPSSKRRLELPCGRCIGCRLERTRQWGVRIAHEAQLHDFSVFVTLTYDDEHLPSDLSVSKRELQLFVKRLRQRVAPLRFRFFGVGEYGSQTWRPHYHVILFGIHFSDQIRLRDTASGHSLYRSPLLEEVWPYGLSSFGSVSFDSARYVAGYCVKKVSGAKAEGHYRRVDPRTGEVLELAPEFALMSRRPGIGAGWFDKFSTDVYPSDQVVLQGVVGKPPRYYDRRAQDRMPEEFEKVRAKRVENAAERFEEGSPARLKVRETVAKARVSQKMETL